MLGKTCLTLNRAHSTAFLTGGLQAFDLLSPTLRCTVLRWLCYYNKNKKFYQAVLCG